jgi:uncharacterized protein
MRRVLGIALAAVAIAGASSARPVPFLAGRVVDEAQMLSPEARQRIEGKLTALEQQTTDQVVVLTIPSLDGAALESYSLEVAQTWHLGQKGKDNGVLLLIARDDRKMRIEVGYGLEGTLTDLKSKQILDDIIRPRFQRGEFGQGVEDGVDGILKVIHGEPLPPPARRGHSLNGFMGVAVGFLVFAVVIGVFSVMALAMRGFVSWFLYVFLLPFYLSFPSAFFGPLAGGILAIAWLVGFPILKQVAAERDWFSSSGGGFWSSFASGGSSGSSGSSGGGFSGGGGSFGGGGASGGW